MLKSYRHHHPRIAASAFIEESAQVIGDVVVGEDASIWFLAVVRGDVHSIRIGRATNIQDGCVLHVQNGEFPLELGERITVGHGVILHGCRIEDDCLIGMGARVLNGASIGRGSIVAAGALVPEGLAVPPGSMCMGLPARVARPLRPEETELIRRSAAHYVGYKNEYRNQR